MRSPELVSAILKCAIVLALGLVSLGASAHTLFWKPDSFYFASGENAVVPLINGTFVKSENRVAQSRIVKASIVSPDGIAVEIEGSQWSSRNDDLTILTTTLKNEGTYVIGVGTKPMTAYMGADKFNYYLRYEGLTEDLNERDALSESSVGAAEKYAKFAKAVVQVGGAATQNFDSVLGHPLEIIPLNNPVGLQVGDSFRVRVLKYGEPLVGELIFATHEGHYEASEEGIFDELVKGRTDDNGEFEFTISEAGRWYVRLIELTRTGDSEHWYSGILVSLGVEEARIPYESLWATLTFEIR
jgi:hypothetical protein